MQSSVLEPEIRSLIEAKDFATLKSALAEMDIHDVAELLYELDDEERAVCFRLLSRQRAADILGEFEPEQQGQLLESLSSQNVAEILNSMPPDDRTELLEELPGELAQKLMNVLAGEQRRVAAALLAYPEESIGRLMTPNYLAVRPSWTVEQVLDHVRKSGKGKETLNVLYVTNKHWKLFGTVRLEELVLAEPEERVEDLMDQQAGRLVATDDEETAIEIFKKYDAVALPVVDTSGTLVGIVTFDDVMDIAEEESTEDFQKMSGMGPLEYSYFGAGYWKMLRSRLPWLVMLLAAQMLTTVALTGFYALPLFSVLVLFMPLINSPAGNTGSQMAGLMIRGIAVQEVQLGDWSRILLREGVRGFSYGLLLAVLGYGAALLFTHMIVPAGFELNPHAVAVSVSAAMLVVVTLANLVGAMLPFAFKAFGADPAVTSGPFIASLMDVSGILIYFNLAVIVLKLVG